MLGKLAAFAVLVWALGFAWFSVDLPQAAPEDEAVSVIVVPTGEGGRIPRGLAVLEQGLAPHLLVTGVDTDVRASEFAVQFEVSDAQMECCVTLGFAALDTHGNAQETADWVRDNDASSLRLVTSDWHMRRAALELSRQLPDSVIVTQDAVETQPSLSTLFVEYHKLLAVTLFQAF